MGRQEHLQRYLSVWIVTYFATTYIFSFLLLTPTILPISWFSNSFKPSMTCGTQMSSPRPMPLAISAIGGVTRGRRTAGVGSRHGKGSCRTAARWRRCRVTPKEGSSSSSSWGHREHASRALLCQGSAHGRRGEQGRRRSLWSRRRTTGEMAGGAGWAQIRRRRASDGSGPPDLEVRWCAGAPAGRSDGSKSQAGAERTQGRRCAFRRNERI